jgi:peptidyl-prolyl cis-trans isomerase A (cyclophilin A)
MKRIIRNLVVALVGGVMLVATEAQAQTGIFADFTTSMGSFTCRLDYAVAPKAVANFIGLASGQRAWLDLPSGRARTNAFYDGLTFHRVISGFMIQGGSPNGAGTDGPGYSFVDEFSSTVRFDEFGVLAMANAGPDSNGSQFFITVSAQSGLNDVHTIFGHLAGGSNVVYAISKVATDSSNNKPLTNVVIQSIGIRRVGSSAQAFNIHNKDLPAVTNLSLAIAAAGDSASLTFTNRQYADNQLYRSTNIASWTAQSLGIETFGSITNTVIDSADLPAEFFRLAQVQYVSTKPVPKSLYGRTFIEQFSDGTFITNIFDNAGLGTYALGTNRGTITQYSYDQDPYRGRIRPIYYSGLYPMVLHCNFATQTNGTFTGTMYGLWNQTVSGKFWLK